MLHLLQTIRQRTSPACHILSCYKCYDSQTDMMSDMSVTQWQVAPHHRSVQSDCTQF